MPGDPEPGKSPSQLTRVINIREAPAGWETDPQYVYIGRPGHGHDGRWGNPFHVKDYGRGGAAQQYEKWLLNPGMEDLRREMRAKLEGKILVCFCKPNACHGDTMCQVINERK